MISHTYIRNIHTSKDGSKFAKLTPISEVGVWGHSFPEAMYRVLSTKTQCNARLEGF